MNSSLKEECSSFKTFNSTLISLIHSSNNCINTSFSISLPYFNVYSSPLGKTSLPGINTTKDSLYPSDSFNLCSVFGNIKQFLSKSTLYSLILSFSFVSNVYEVPETNIKCSISS